MSSLPLWQLLNIANSVELADPFAAWYAALANVNSAQARVFWVGDSILEGTGASTRAKRSLDLIGVELRSTHPASGMGACEYLPGHYAIPSTITPWAPNWYTSTAGTITARNSGIESGGGTPTNTFGLGLRSDDYGSSGSRTYTFTGTDLDVWTCAGGGVQVAIDGGSWSATIDTSGQNPYAEVTQIHLGTSGTHTFSIRRITGTVRILGFTVYDGGRDAGIASFEACHYGAAVPDFYDVGTPSAPQNAKLVRNLQVADPHLVVLNTGLNNAVTTTAAQLVTQYAGLIDIVRATVPSASVCAVMVYNQVPGNTVINNYGETASDFYNAVLAMFVSKNMPTLQLNQYMPDVWTDTNGYYQADGLHLTDKGHALMAQVIEQYIDPDYVAPPMTLTGTLPNATVGVAYSARLTFGGTFITPVTAGLQSGSLPSWMTATADSTGITYAGTPTIAASAVTFTPKATDSTTPTAQVAIGSAQSITVDALAYATWDPAGSGYGHTLSNGNLTVSCGDSDGGITTPLSSGVTAATGGRYFECTIDVLGTEASVGFGNASFANGKPPGEAYSSPPTDYGIYQNGNVYAGQSLGGNIGMTYGTGDTVQLYLAPGGGVYFGKIGTGWVPGADPTIGDPPLFTLLPGTWRPAAGGVAPSPTGTAITANFGSTAWAGTPPSGATGWTM